MGKTPSIKVFKETTKILQGRFSRNREIILSLMKSMKKRYDLTTRYSSTCHVLLRTERQSLSTLFMYNT